MKALILILFALTLLSTKAISAVEVKSIDFKSTKHRGTLIINYRGTLIGDPELVVSGKSIQVVIPNSKVKSPIEKSVSFSSKLKDTNLKAYQTTKNVSKIKANFVFNMANKIDFVNLTLRDRKIELSFPRVRVKLRKAPKYASIIAKKNKKTKIKKDFLNEDYLNKLLNVKKTAKNKKNKFNRVIKATPLKKDLVKTTLAAPARENTFKSGSNISLMKYAGKFVAFLGVVLLLFYGVITLIKKGVIKKGKLGFLNNSEQVSVISTTHIAPKKSLMLIKAHNQVFLVSNTETGIHPISEIKDAAGLFKSSEISISGTNFDSSFNEASTDSENDLKIKMKEDIMVSNRLSSESSYEEVKEKVSFSSQLKKKVKNLKPMQ